MPALISPQTRVKVVGGYGTSADHVLAMAFDDPTMDADLRETQAAREIVLGDEWTDGQPRLGLVCATEGDESLEQRLNTWDAVAQPPPTRPSYVWKTLPRNTTKPGTVGRGNRVFP